MIIKKLVFTTLAVVAFSGVAMAETVEVKETKAEKKVVVLEDCYSKAADYTDKNAPDASSEGANDIYQAY